MSRFTNPVPQFWLDNGTIASSGRMKFFENKDYSTLKNTFNDALETVANTNPVSLDGQGRMPPCFGTGLYSVKFYAYDNTQPDGLGALQWTRDDVDFSDGGTGLSIDWSAVVTYAIGALVKDDGRYWLLYGSTTSVGERPSTTPFEWDEIVFITIWSSSKTYSIDEIIKYGGFLYRSLEDDNEDTPPSAKWANLTFNDSIAGDLTVSGAVTAGSYSGGGVLTQTVPGGVLVAVKSAAQTVTSSTVLVDATDMAITLANGIRYHIRAHISWRAGATMANGIKVTFIGASHPCFAWIANTNTSTANAAPTANASGGIVQFTKMPNTAVNADEDIIFDAVVTGAGTAYKMQFAQAVSDAIATQLNTATCMIATRLN